MTVALLVLIVLILLFGASAVKGWIKGAALGICGLFLGLALIGWLVSSFEENTLWWMIGVGGMILFVGSIWARSYDDGEAEHRRRIERAQEQRRKRREEGKNW